jgi:pentatricopeptide repeat protein
MAFGTVAINRNFLLLLACKFLSMLRKIPHISFIRYSTLTLPQAESVIDACVRANDIFGSITHYNKIISNGVRPTEKILISLLELAAKNISSNAAKVIWESYQFMEFQPTLELYLLILKTYVTQRDPPSAWKFFLELKKTRIPLDIHIYNTALEALIYIGNQSQVLQFYRELFAVGLEPNEETFSVIMKYFVKSRKLDECLFWYRLMEKNVCQSDIPAPANRIEPTDITNTLLFQGYIRSGTWITAMQFVKRLTSAGKVGEMLLNDAIQLSTLWLRVRDTLDLVELSYKYNIELSSRAYSSIAKMYYRLEDVGEAKKWINSAHSFGKEVDASVEGTLIRMLLKQKNYDKAYSVATQALNSKSPVHKGMLIDIAVSLCHNKYLHDTAAHIPLEDVNTLLEQIWEAYQIFRSTSLVKPIRIYKALLDHYTVTNQFQKAENVFEALLDDSLYLPLEEGVAYAKLLIASKGWNDFFSIWDNHVHRKTIVDFRSWMQQEQDLQNIRLLSPEMFTSHTEGYPNKLNDPKRELYLLHTQYATCLSFLQEHHGLPKEPMESIELVHPALNKRLLTPEYLWSAWQFTSQSSFDRKRQFANLLIRLCELLGYFKLRSNLRTASASIKQ